MKRDRVALILILSALAGMLLALALPAHAQESAPVVVVPGTPWFDQPWFLGLCGALISMGIGALKKSSAGAWLDKSALRDMAAVLIASALAALPHLASGWPAFGYAVLGHVVFATVAWAGASGVAKVSAERKAAGLDAEQK